MAEQEGRTAPLVAPGVESESADVRRLPHLISGAGASRGDNQIALALEINTVLIAMRAPGHEAEESAVLISALDEHLLDGMVDDAGRACRKEAVETLLACGFPHALKVSPEDLDFARSWKPPSTSSANDRNHPLSRSRRRGAILTLVSQVPLIVSVANPHPGWTAPVAMLVGVAAALVAAMFAGSKPDVEKQASYGTLLGMLALIQAACALDIGAPALLGAVGIVAGLGVSFASQYQPPADPPKPGDWDGPSNRD